MYSRDGRSREPANAAGSFSDGFLDAMGDEFEDTEPDGEQGLPLIEEDILVSGKYQNVILEEASIDEPLPGMEKVLVPREEKWDYGTADFHGSHEQRVKEQHSSSPAHLPTEFSPERYEPPVAEDDSLAIFGDLEAEPRYIEEAAPELSPLDTEGVFDSVEEQQDSDYDDDDIASILAGIEPAKNKSSISDGDEEGDPQFESGLQSNFRVSPEDEELMQGFEIDEIISFAIDVGASDIHINPNQRIGIRVNGSITKINRFEPIPAEITRRIQQKIVTNVADDIFLNTWELDTSYTVKSGPHRGRRVRVSVTKGFEETVMVMRIISQTIPLPHELEIEDELLEWAELPNGLVLMNGPTGTGKSTTLASIIQNIQMRLDGVIITVEKPVEYMYKDQGLAMVYQREVGRDTLSFSAALDSAMRMDPDVILIGETRNSVEMDALLYAADTGHLSLSTTHANSTSETLNRIKRMYSGDERKQALESLSAVARGFAAQVLCKTVDGKGRFAVREILTVDREISDLIMDGDSRKIRRLQEDRGTTLDHGLVRAVSMGRTTVTEARRKSPSPRYFDTLLADLPKIL